MIGLDTNVLVRYLTDDDHAQSQTVRHFFEKELTPSRPGFLSLVTLAETIWVLQSVFGAKSRDLLPILATLADDPRLAIQDVKALWLALESCEDGSLDLADALVAHVAREHGCSHTVTFDRKAARLPGMVLLRQTTS
jgi:predicted nucleic-acid-binding protein